MPQIILFLDKEENQIVELHKKKWKLSKQETIRKIIKEVKR